MYTPAASSPASPLWGAQGGWPRGRAPLEIRFRVLTQQSNRKKTWAKKKNCTQTIAWLWKKPNLATPQFKFLV